MKAGKITINEVKGSHQVRFKPSTFLNEGLETLRILNKVGAIKGSLNDFLIEVFRPGIFKRNFLYNKSAGISYIPAASMTTSDPLHFSKILSTKYTENLSSMILKRDMILFSCAGTIGNVRYIDKCLNNVVGSQDIIRIVSKQFSGFVFAYLSSRFVQDYIQSKVYGSVVARLEPIMIEQIPLVSFGLSTIIEIDGMIKEAVNLREEASDELALAEKTLKEKAGLKDLTPDDYDYFGQHSALRRPSCFIRKASNVGTVSFNAFNHSERIKSLRSKLPKSQPISALIENGQTFSSTGAPSIEVKPGCGIMLINQKDIFDTIVKGKHISKRGIKTVNLVEYGEVLIASDGTLGENETFCRAIFANEDLQGAFLSSHFLRMRIKGEVPAGYIFCWLNSDYGFRLIRQTQSGTKICHPINSLFLDIPVPIIEKKYMDEIDRLVRTAHTKRHEANVKELKAISMIESEIEKWKS